MNIKFNTKKGSDTKPSLHSVIGDEVVYVSSEQTEKKFSEWCKKKGYFCMKLQVAFNQITQKTGRLSLPDQNTRSEVRALAKGMPSDYLVVTPQQVFFVEVKEVANSQQRFLNSRLRQQYKLYKLHQMFPEHQPVKSLVILNFCVKGLRKDKDKVACLDIIEYNQLLRDKNAVSTVLQDYENKGFVYGWKSLELG